MFTLSDRIDGKVATDYARFYTRPYESLQSYGFLGFDLRYAKRILFHSVEQNGYSITPSHKIIETTDEGLWIVLKTFW
uniref:hypothetical protein n=1 Tax=Ornithobacterium rhinotracheale TaxID=28251 RepID=UPI0016259724|nr:hypothetical protein [Ornithobacterium rhinotracheale]